MCFGIFSNAFAQNQEEPEPLVTDRPDATEASRTVPKGALQIETGAFYTSFEKDDIKEEVVGYNTTLVRYGILENFELRLGWNFEEGRRTIDGMKSGNVTSGLSPLLAGMKVDITEEKGLIPEIALIGHIFLPFSASSDYRPETTGTDFRFSLSNTLSEKSSIGYNIGVQWGADSPEAAYVYTLAYGYSITDKFGFYAEVYGDFPEDSRANHFWDAGLTYLLMYNLQVDATIGRGITEGQDILLSAGLSYRIPK
jgi:hypothetical protein